MLVSSPDNCTHADTQCISYTVYFQFKNYTFSFDLSVCITNHLVNVRILYWVLRCPEWYSTLSHILLIRFIIGYN